MAGAGQGAGGDGGSRPGSARAGLPPSLQLPVSPRGAAGAAGARGASPLGAGLLPLPPQQQQRPEQQQQQQQRPGQELERESGL